MGKTNGRGGRLKKLAIAFYCWTRGYFSADSIRELRSMPDSTCESEKEGVPIWDSERGRLGIRVERNRIPEYASEDFWEAVQMWKDWKTFGFPESGGLNNQPCLWTMVIRNMEYFSREFSHGES